jgi:hypothetical protein
MLTHAALRARLISFFFWLLQLGFAALSLFLSLPQPAFAQAVSATKLLDHTPAQVAAGKAKLIQHYDLSKMLRLTIALNPPHTEEERQFIDALHDKHSPEFHKFLTAEEWNARFSPAPEDEEAVVSWAESQGFRITHRYKNRLLVDVEASAGAIEKALAVRINNYEMDSKSYFSIDRDPEIPAQVAGKVQAVLGLHSFMRLRPALSNSHPEKERPDYVGGPAIEIAGTRKADGSAAQLADAMKHTKARTHRANEAANGFKPNYTDLAYDPTDLYSSQAYDWNALAALQHCCNPLNNSAGSPPEASIAIAAFGAVNFNDLAGFHNQYPYLAYNVTELTVDGGHTCNDQPGAPDDDCIEATLDTEYSLAMANSFGSGLATAKVFIYNGASFSHVADVYNHIQEDGYAKVASTSWACEEITCFNAPSMKAMNNIFASMVGQGWTLVGASGDQGATAGCGDALALNYPSSDPNMVAAGGTTLFVDSGVYQYEVAWEGTPWAGSCAQNYGGSTGGFSKSSFGIPTYQSRMGFPSRAVPDISLNAEAPQNMYYAKNGGLFAVGGTSIVAPELAGFFAQENAYALSLGNVCGGSGTAPCAPIGNADYVLYTEGLARVAPHYPFYDITKRCNDNDVTTLYGLTPFCAGTGFDEVTGWGSANMLQLAWTFNWFDAAASGAPSINFAGPATNTWFNSDQLIDWNIIDNPGISGFTGTGIAGFTQGWDSIPNDSFSEPTPGTGDSFYSGPQQTNTTFGCTEFSGNICTGVMPQGCHTLYVRAWNNMGISSGAQSYGPVCYDNAPPKLSGSVSGAKNGSAFVSTATVHLSASDATSGVQAIYYRFDGGPFVSYSSPFAITAPGSHSVGYEAIDFAGNVSSYSTIGFDVVVPTTIKLSANATSVAFGSQLSLFVNVGWTSGPPPGGTVTFKNGSAIIGTAPLLDGSAHLSTTALGVGAHSLTASYGGSSTDAGSTSPVLAVTVSKAKTTITVTSSLDPSTPGSKVTFTAAVKSGTTGTPAGTVTFKDGTVTLGSATLNAGKAAFATTALAKGVHTITAVYGGNTDYLAITSAKLTQTVN